MPQENDHIRSFVDRIQELEAEIKERNSDKADVFKEAKSAGIDVPALKEVLRLLRKDPAERTELQTLVVTYLAALDNARARTRARTREEANTSAS